MVGCEMPWVVFVLVLAVSGAGLTTLLSIFLVLHVRALELGQVMPIYHRRNRVRQSLQESTNRQY